MSEVMLPQGRSADPFYPLGGLDGSSLGQLPPSSSGFSQIQSLMADAVLFAGMLMSMGQQTQGSNDDEGTPAPQDAASASPAGGGARAGDAETPSAGLGSPGQSPANPQQSLPSNLSVDQMKDLKSAQAAPPDDSSAVPAASDDNATNARSTATGTPKSVDGAQPGSDTIDLKERNTSNHDENIDLENSQNKVFDKEHLKSGQSQDLLLSANDQNTKSMRNVVEGADGSPQNNDAKIGEMNIQDQDGKAVSSDDISNNNFVGVTGIDGKNVNGIEMKFSDDNGKTTGDNTNNPAYRNSVDDASAMNMAMDPSQNITLDVNQTN